ncbi:MAG: phasin family protein [Pseudomonadota bacterium]
MATTKKATKKTPAKKTAKAKAEAATAEAEQNVESILTRIQSGFKEAGAALSESGSIMGDKRREILMTMIENAQENADATFEALREVMEAESISDSVRIQRDALRHGIERNVAQVRDMATMTRDSSRESMEPVAEYLSTLRGKVKAGAEA